MNRSAIRVLGWISCLALPLMTSGQTPGTRVPLVFSGGHETVGVDRGRPVILIASALKVPPEVFRQAFANVHPAPAGQEPEPGQVRQNKEVLMMALSPFGVTNERLDEVSNYYRYRRQSGELWRHTEAEGYAEIEGGTVARIVITRPGSGYSSPPTVTIAEMPGLSLSAHLAFTSNLAENGSIKDIGIQK
jgi:hypothetical protein